MASATKPFAVETVSGKYIVVQAVSIDTAGRKIREEYGEEPKYIWEVK